jgi:hypothetical protein
MICCIKCLSFWKGIDNVKPERISCDCEYHVFSLNHMLFHFCECFTLQQPDKFVIC